MGGSCKVLGFESQKEQISKEGQEDGRVMEVVELKVFNRREVREALN